MYRETLISYADVREYALTTSQTLEPLGAYASNGRIRYLFLEEAGVFGAMLEVNDEPVPSLTPLMPLFDWHEREMREKQNIAFQGHPDGRPLFGGAANPDAAVTAEGKGVNVVVVGPVHAGIIEPGRFTFSTGGETVIHLDSQLGFSHRNLEPSFEGRDAAGAAYFIARICGGCSVARSWAYARAVEALAGIEVDEPAELSRVVFAELERLYNHVFDLGSSCAGAGFGRGHTFGLRLKEQLQQLCAEICGHRLLFDAVCPGGVRQGVLRQPLELRSKLQALRGDVERFTDELFDNGSVVRRFDDSGILDSNIARAFGVVGPARRASGGAIDVRAYAPYGPYRRLAVRTAIAEAGDVLARCEVKRQEIAESFRLLEEVLSALGRVPARDPLYVAAGEGAVTTAVEGARGAETVSVEADARGRLKRVHIISASYRSWPVVGRAMEGNIIPDFPLVNKSFNLCYSCADR
jgi:Ni,Fe-hydrogenase III large subunit